MADISEIKELAHTLNLMNVYNGSIDLTDEKISNLDYLYNILKQEVDIRRGNKKKAIQKGSHIPINKVFDDAGITQGMRWQLHKIEELDYSKTNEKIVIVGDVATGKTSLATKIAKDAINKQNLVVYVTEEDLLLEYRKQKTMWNKLLKADLIILDELFYLTPTDENLKLLYKIIMFLSEARSFVFVTNRPLSEWDKIAVDKHIISTFRQRIMTDAQLIHLG